METINLNYSVDISESSTENGDFIIQGTAINATTTDNGHRFLVEELRPAAKGMTGIPLLVDHDALVANIKGRVLSGTFNESEEKIDFKAKVMDKLTIEMIKDKRINSVSIGANVNEIEENDDGTITARGIKIKELSLVAVPADDGATFAIAMSEAYERCKGGKKPKPKLNEESNLQVMKGGLSEKMKENAEDVKPTEEVDTKEEEKSEPVVTEEKLRTLVAESVVAAMKAFKEADVDETPVEEPTEEAKEEEAVEEETETEEESEEEEEDKAEESNELDIQEGNGSLRGNSFSYNW